MKLYNLCLTENRKNMFENVHIYDNMSNMSGAFLYYCFLSDCKSNLL